MRKTNVISMSYRNRDPEDGCHECSKHWLPSYMEKHLEMHRPSGELKFFDQLTKQYKQGLDQAQQKITDFTNGTGVVSAQLERDSVAAASRRIRFYSAPGPDNDA